MPLTYFLYSCPRCGHDPLGGEGDRAECQACGASFTREGATGRIRLEASDGDSGEIEPAVLRASLEERGAPRGALAERDGKEEYTSPAVLRRSIGEEPVRHGGSLLGFVERMGPEEVGSLKLRGNTLSFEVGEGTIGQWSLLDLRSIQTSSSALQVTGQDGMVEFRFRGDSPRRWETLLHGLLREAYREQGRGEIVEFQPRIVAERAEGRGGREESG